MTSLGEQLRAQREKKGITLEQAAADTRIREKFLHALEEGDHRSLPGAVYTRGFLRNYSDYLDLDTDELIETFRRSASDRLSPHRSGASSRTSRSCAAGSSSGRSSSCRS